MPFTYPRRPYTLDELKDMTREDIINRCSDIIVDKNSLMNNMKLFLDCAKLIRINSILASDYESVIILDDIKEKGLFNRDKVYLLDDYEQKDRSYIDITKLNNIRLIVPNTYAMWNIKFNDKLYCYQYLYNNKGIENDTFSGYYDKETLIEAERIALMIKDFGENLTDVEKIILISNYLQKYCRYKDDKEMDSKELGDPKTALFEWFGICRTFADATTLLSNNPYLNLKVRNVRSEKHPVHAWNIIEIDGIYYQIDNSRAISNGLYLDEKELRANKFNKEYILFGSNIKHEEIVRGLRPNNLSENGYDKRYIEAAIEYLDDTNLVDFDYKKGR